MKIAGIQTNTTSLAITQKMLDTKWDRFSDGAFNGLQGRKKRDSSNGEKNAIPSPPSVIASRKPCDAVTRKK